MEKEDTRTQSREQLYTCRKPVLRLHQQDHRFMRIVELTVLSYPTVVRNAIQLFQAGGSIALTSRSTSRKVGARRNQSVEQKVLPRQVSQICSL
jgi:hypothetical protein